MFRHETSDRCRAGNRSDSRQGSEDKMPRVSSNLNRPTVFGKLAVGLHACLHLYRWQAHPRAVQRSSPFDIRVTVRTWQARRSAEAGGRLNPFDIRATVRTHGRGSDQYGGKVLIPLISGQLFGPRRLSTMLSPCVLIPLISGQLFGLLQTEVQSVRGLNPFDIRATVRTPRRPRDPPADQS